MRGRSTVNFLAKTLFACSAKVVSSVRDQCGEISAAGRTEAKFQGQSDKDVAPGLNALAGLRYFATDRIAFFAEYKYNRAAYDFPDAIRLKADYSANHFLGGVSFHI